MANAITLLVSRIIAAAREVDKEKTEGAGYAGYFVPKAKGDKLHDALEAFDGHGKKI